MHSTYSYILNDQDRIEEWKLTLSRSSKSNRNEFMEYLENIAKENNLVSASGDTYTHEATLLGWDKQSSIVSENSKNINNGSNI